MRPWPIYGMYQPDAIKLFTFRGTEYIIMSNEGDTKDYPPYFSEVDRVRNIDLSDVFGKLNRFICLITCKQENLSLHGNDGTYQTHVGTKKYICFINIVHHGKQEAKQS